VTAGVCEGDDAMDRLTAHPLAAALAQAATVFRRSDDTYFLGCRVTRLLVEVAQYPAAWLLLHETEEEPTLVPVAETGLPAGLPDPLVLAIEPRHFAVEAFLSGTARAARVLEDPIPAEMRSIGAPSGIALPLRGAGRTRGVLIVFRRDPQPPDATEQALLDSLAALTAAHIDRLESAEGRTRAEDQFETLVKNIPGVVYLCNNDARYTMLYLSESVETLTGHPAADFLADRISFVDLYHPEDAPRIAPIVSDALEKRHPFVLRYRLRNTNDDWCWVEERGQGVFGADGKLRFLEGALFDVSDRVRALEEQERLQLQLLQSQKLESLGLLAGGIAHDFNNLLTGVLGMSTLALADLPEEHPAHAAVSSAIDAAERASKLTVQLLAYSGKGTFDIRPLDLSQQVHEISELVRTSISKKVIVETSLADGLPLIEADTAQLQQLTMNLVMNAAEALHGGKGAVRVSTGSRELRHDELAALQPMEDRPEGLYVFLRVEDDGVGMSPATLARIFDPFFTTKATGRGLGLAAVVGIVRAHGGGLDIRSEPGRGSTFTVYLPATTAEALEHVSQPVGDLFGNGTILVVDDELVVRNLAVNALVRHGYRVICAENGRRALEVYDEQRDEIDLVLLDMTMPEMDGAETLGELRSRDPELPVILSSGYSEFDTSRRLSDANRPTGFLEKPYTATALAAMIRAALFTQTREI